MAPSARELLEAAAAQGSDLESVARGVLERLAELTGLSSTYLAETRLIADEQYIVFSVNRSDQFHIPEAHRKLVIQSRSSVVTYPRPAPIPVSADSLPELRPRFFEFLAPTRRVPLDRDWAAAMRAPVLSPDGDLVDYLSSLTRYLHGFFTYRQEVTKIDTPIEDFVRSGVGVCQDYTHAMLAVCRMRGIPSRYVSGYLETTPGRNLGSDASHAWVEAYLPGSGWVGFDPTNGTIVGQTYVKVGHGRDYDDVPPVKGLRRGGGTESLRVAVSVLRAPGAGATAASSA